MRNRRSNLGTPLAGGLLLAGLALAGTSAFADEEFDAALSAFRAGNYTEAERRFGVLVEANPSWSAGRATWGQCAYLLGRPDDAERRIEQAIEADPATNRHEAYLLPGQLLYRERRFAEAVRPLRRALDAGPEPSHRATASMLGYALTFSGAYAEARPVLREVLDRHGFAPEPAYYLALACRRTEDLDCAVELLRQVAATDFGRDPRHKTVELLARWSYARALAPRNAAVRDALLVDALPTTRAWFEAEPDSESALVHRGENLLGAGRPERLIEEIGPLVEREDAPCAAPLLVARAQNALARPELAAAAAQRAAACDPDSAAAQLELAVARAARLPSEYRSLDEVERGRDVADRATAALDRALALDPALGARADSLRDQLRRTRASLDAAQRDFIQVDRDYDGALDRAVRQRCLGLVWRMRDGAAPLSEEERSYVREHDCRSYVPESR